MIRNYGPEILLLGGVQVHFESSEESLGCRQAAGLGEECVVQVVIRGRRSEEEIIERIRSNINHRDPEPGGFIEVLDPNSLANVEVCLSDEDLSHLMDGLRMFGANTCEVTLNFKTSPSTSAPDGVRRQLLTDIEIWLRYWTEEQ